MKIIKQNNAKIEENNRSATKKVALLSCPPKTVYGAFVDATNEKAVERLNKYKKKAVWKTIFCCRI